MQAAAKTFFTAPHFAVAGASSDPSKFGHKIFGWYLTHQLSAVPLNPTMPSVKIYNQTYPTLASPRDLPHPHDTSLSVITPPAITAKLLKEAKEAGVKAVWLQPGSFGEEEFNYAVREFPGAAVAGYEDGPGGGEGWCVLVDGEAAMAEGGRTEKL